MSHKGAHREGSLGPVLIDTEHGLGVAQCELVWAHQSEQRLLLKQKFTLELKEDLGYREVKELPQLKQRHCWKGR